MVTTPGLRPNLTAACALPLLSVDRVRYEAPFKVASPCFTWNRTMWPAILFCNESVIKTVRGMGGVDRGPPL